MHKLLGLTFLAFSLNSMLAPLTPLFSHVYAAFASLLALVLFCSHDHFFFWFFLDSSWFDTLWHSQPLCSYLSIAFLDGLVLLCILNLAALPPACFDALYFAPMHGPSAYAMHQPSHLDWLPPTTSARPFSCFCCCMLTSVDEICLCEFRFGEFKRKKRKFYQKKRRKKSWIKDKGIERRLNEKCKSGTWKKNEYRFEKEKRM